MSKPEMMGQRFESSVFGPREENAARSLSETNEVQAGVERRETEGGMTLTQTIESLAGTLDHIHDNPDNFQDSFIKLHGEVEQLPVGADQKEQVLSGILTYIMSHEDFPINLETKDEFLDVLGKLEAEYPDNPVWAKVIEKQGLRTIHNLLDRINGKSGSFGPAIEQYQEPEKPDSKVESSLSQRLEDAFKSTEVKHAPDEEEEQVEMAPFEDQKEIEAEPEQVDEVEEQSEVDEMQAEVEPEPVEPEEANEPDPELESSKRELEQIQETINTEEESIRDLVERVNPALIEASSSVLGFENKEKFETWLERAKNGSDEVNNLEQAEAA